MTQGSTVDFKALVAARLKAGLSQSAVSRKVGIHNSHISKIERGLHSMPMERLAAFAEVYRVPLADLLMPGVLEANRPKIANIPLLGEDIIKTLMHSTGLAGALRNWNGNTVPVDVSHAKHFATILQDNGIGYRAPPGSQIIVSPGRSLITGGLYLILAGSDLLARQYVPDVKYPRFEPNTLATPRPHTVFMVDKPRIIGMIVAAFTDTTPPEMDDDDDVPAPILRAPRYGKSRQRAV